MGCFIKRREMVMRLPTRFHKLVTALGVPAISLSRDAPATRLCEVVVLLVLSYQLRVLRYPERYAALGVEAPVFQGCSKPIKGENILDFKPKHWKQWEDAGVQCVIETQVGIEKSAGIDEQWPHDSNYSRPIDETGPKKALREIS
jgi:hypothetical protein